MFDFVKSFQQRRIIKNLLERDRVKKIQNIQDVYDIGLIFNVGLEHDWKIIEHFVKIMEKANKRVFIIGYQESSTELSFIITHPKTVICHEKTDFDFWGVPHDHLCDEFTQRHYDLLIDTTDEKNFFTRYIVLKSNADLRVTYLDTKEQDDQETDIYDFTIRSEGMLNMKDYLNNVVSYLNMIQK